MELNKDINNQIIRYLILSEMASLANTSKLNNELLHDTLVNAYLAHPLLKAVVEANPKRLGELVKNSPQLLFKKGQIKDPSGQTFYNVSAYQLMIFLLDGQMYKEIMALITVSEDIRAIIFNQYAALAEGGADLIKLNFNPGHILSTELLQCTIDCETFAANMKLTIPLLENKDGVIYYKAANTRYLYYINRELRIIAEIQVTANTEEEQKNLDKIYADFDDMEDNSSRRSSSIEHKLITRTMRCQSLGLAIKLFRKGVEYDACNGVRYRNNSLDLNLYFNINRKSIRLCEARDLRNGQATWLQLGKKQRELIWLLQYFCQTNLTFFPTPNFAIVPNKRELRIFGNQTIFANNKLVDWLGVSRAIYKSWYNCAQVCEYGAYGEDLIAVHMLIESAKNTIREVNCNLNIKLLTR